MPAPPDGVESANGLLTFAYVAGGAVGAFVLGWLGYTKKPHEPPPQTFSVQGALVDNKVVNPLIDALSELVEENKFLREDIRKLRDVFMEDAQRRAEMAKEQEIRVRFEAENRMQELLEKLEAKTKERGL